MTSAHVLLVSCPDRPGLVASVSGLIAAVDGNITDADQHTDHAEELFLQRVEFTMADSRLADLTASFAELADATGMEWSLARADQRPRVALLVSRQGHCLYDLLARWELGELGGDLVAVLSNHDDFRSAVERTGLPFIHLPIDPDDKAAQRSALRSHLNEIGPDLIVLARYMQILDEDLIDGYPSRIINIHHSFLPAFVGARPYHQAYERGVKVIGATAHYATAALDEGPIICQDVTPVSHRDTPERLVQRGRDLEGIVLARAVQLHLQRRVLTTGHRTVVFD